MNVMTNRTIATLQTDDQPIIANVKGQASLLCRTPIRVVIPCFNEEKRLDGQQFIDFAVKNTEVHFVFVDDGSTDGTLQLLKNLQWQMENRIDVLALPKNVGKAEAVRTGLQKAADDGAELVAYWDADLATPLSAILDFSDIADRYCDVDVVFGSRMQLLGHRIKRSPVRRVVSRICSGMARAAIRLPVRDTQCGAKLLRNTPAFRDAIDREFTAGWLFDVELFARISAQANDHRRGFFEFPLTEWTEVPGSNVDTSVVVKSGFKMLKLVVESRMGRYPSKPSVLSTTAEDNRLAA